MTKLKLQRHIDGVHLGLKPYFCKYCNTYYSQRENRDSHEYEVHEQRKPFICTVCSRAFPKTGNLKVHMKVHEPKENCQSYVCEVENCNKVFVSKGNLKKHMPTHSESRLFLCNKSECGKTFKDQKGLNRHVKNCKK